VSVCVCTEEQIAAIEMVSGLINHAEADMSANRDTYQAAVQSRNNTGLLVIDRWVVGVGGWVGGCVGGAVLQQMTFQDKGSICSTQTNSF
jgi:hypothetical protein